MINSWMLLGATLLGLQEVAVAGSDPGDRPVPPPCPSAVHQRRPGPAAPASFPEFFARMGETFARNPATGFPSLMQEMSRLEGPALDGVRLTIAEEQAIGRQARSTYLRQASARGVRVVDDRARRAYLEELVAGLSRHMTHRARYPRLEVTLIDAPVPDAHSFPGGSLVFTTALLKESDEATVAAVVAHELAHLELGHLYDYARREKLAAATYSRSPASRPDLNRFMTRQMALFGLMMAPYRPEHEHEADCLAATWLFLDGYDPAALSAFLDRQAVRLQDDKSPEFLALFRSHPPSAERSQAVRERTSQLRLWHPDQPLDGFADNLRRGRSHYRPHVEKD